jgi:FKBP-type peptidyl-prolyl cis-trans isomerase FkpA
MSDITPVPLRPIKEGAMTRLWLGVGAACFLAAGLAWAGTKGATAGACDIKDFGKGTKAVTSPTGLMVQTVKAGQGASPTDADMVLIDYKGTLRDGKVFDQNQRVPMEVAGVVPGFSEALKMMQTGGAYKICIPPSLGYGATAQGPIPANSVLLFDINMLDFKTKAEIEAIQRQMQQMQQQGQMPPGMAPGGSSQAPTGQR